MKDKKITYQFIHPIDQDGKKYTIEFFSYDKPEKSETTGELESVVYVRDERGEELCNFWPPQFKQFDDKIKDELLADILRQFDVILTTYEK